MIKKSRETITIGGETLSYLLYRSKKRSRSLSMKIRKDGQLQLNVPFRTNLRDVHEFIQNKYYWIKEKSQKKVALKPPKNYLDGELHKYLGKDYPLKLITAQFSKVEWQNDFIQVFHRKNASIENLVKNWYRQQSLDYLTQRTHDLAVKFQLPEIRAIKVRFMRARWGSCNSLAEITYNVHLIKKAVDCIDYVIIHELCHLIHQNHGKGFYQLQTTLNPNWKQQKNKLQL